MKRFILFLTINLIAVGAMAQLTRQGTPKSVTVGEVKSGLSFVAHLVYLTDGTDTAYSLIFRNLKYQHIADVQHIEFNGQQTADQLYSLLTGILTDQAKEVGYKETVTLGETMMIITKQKMMGVYYLTLFCEKGYFNLTKKQVDKLFNR